MTDQTGSAQYQVPWFPPQGGDIALIERCMPGGDPYSIVVCWHHDDQAWWNATGVPGPMKAQPELSEFRELVVRKNRLVPKAIPAVKPVTAAGRAADALAVIIARNRFGSGVDMGGAHNPRPSEERLARQFIRDLLDAGWIPLDDN